MSAVQSLIGLLCFTAIAWGLGHAMKNRAGQRTPPVRFIAAALGLQVALAALFIHAPGSSEIFAVLNRAVLALQEATRAGTSLVFGYLGGGPLPYQESGAGSSFILAFQALPLVLVISALAALLFHWGIMQKIVGGFAWALRRTLGVSGPLGVGASANIFVGMVESPILVRPYLAKMTRSDLFALMVCGMATIAGTMLALYAQFLSGVVRDAAGHLIAASVISVPAALLIARLMVPSQAAESGTPDPEEHAPAPEGALPPELQSTGAMQAITMGTLAGLQLLLSIIAMLIVLVALVALADSVLGLFPDLWGTPLTLERIFGWMMAPLVWLVGIPWAEAQTAGALMGTKTVLNELLAFLALSDLPPDALGARSRLLMTYALCGFANPGSVGIMIGGLSVMAPDRRSEIAALGIPALVGGTLATLMTAAAVGLVSWSSG